MQRGVRVTAAVALLLAVAAVVAGAIAASTLVDAAAVLAVLGGAGAARMLYSEVLQTRRDSARTCAAQALAFRDTMAESSAEHLAFHELMTARVLERDLTVSRLTGALRLAEQRVDQVKQRAEEAARRAGEETRRANETQRRLGELVDEVFGTALVDVDVDRGLTLLPSVRRIDSPVQQAS